MPTTYTDNTGITKPGPGEQSGTWGTTVNTNFDIIDRALNDVGTITLSGSTFTLTTNNGSLSDGQYRTLVFVGTLGSDCTVTIDPNGASKTYLVKNDTTGGFSVILSQGNGSGGTLTVPAGQVAVAYTDGAGVGAKVDGQAFSSITDALTFSGAVKVQATNTGATITGNLINDGVEVLTGGYLNGAPGSTMSLEGYFNNGTENIAVGDLALGGTATPNSMSGAGKNVALGAQALKLLASGEYNTAVGYRAHWNMINGTQNVAIGREAGLNQRSTGNVSIGATACSIDNLNGALGTDGENVSVGYKAGGQVGSAPTVSSGYRRNVCIGSESGITLGGSSRENVIVGYRSGPNVQSASNVLNCVFIGENAGQNATTCNLTTAVGQEAGLFVTSGGLNSFFGNRAGNSGSAYLTGIQNTAVGNFACSNGLGHNNTTVGNGAGNSGSPLDLTGASQIDDRVIIGNNDVTNAYINVAWTVTSDVRDKTNIEQVTHGLEFLSSFSPIKFQYTNNREENAPHGFVHYGYSAQDVLAAEGENPVIVDTEQDQKLKMKETQLIPILHNAILELKEENAALRARLDAAGI